MKNRSNYQTPSEFEPKTFLKSNQELTQIDGDRIRLAREAKQLSLAELADLTGTSIATVHRWETNSYPPDSKLKELSEALGYPESFFLGGKIITPFILSPNYRTTTTMGGKNKKTAEARAYIRYDQVLRIFKRWLDYRWGFEQHDPADYETPETIARIVRQEWGIPRGPIPDLIKAIESKGILVFLENFTDSELDGLSFCAPGHPPIIFLNSDRPGERIRFTLAHELGHVIMHKVENQCMEEEADKFAAEFLMPEEDIYNQLLNIDSYNLPNLKNYWKVSMQALVLRASRLQAISKQKYQTIYREMMYKKYKKNEPYPIPRESPELPKVIIETIIGTTRISLEKLAEEIGASKQDIQSGFLRRHLTVFK